jgi:hypothetical protein
LANYFFLTAFLAGAFLAEHEHFALPQVLHFEAQTHFDLPHFLHITFYLVSF